MMDNPTPREQLLIVVTWLIALLLGGGVLYVVYLFMRGLWRLAS